MNNAVLGCLAEQTGDAARAIWPDEPYGQIHRQLADDPTARLGYASAKRTQGTMIFPQTKPTSANEANLKNLMKTMFEHEQHDSLVLGRANLRCCASNLAGRTRRAPQGIFGQTNPRSRPSCFLAERTREADQPVFSQTILCRWVVMAALEAHSHRSGTRSTTANSGHIKSWSSLPSPDLIRGLTRQSIFFARRWMRGSTGSPPTLSAGCPSRA